jgi:hypothetical protein
VRAGATFLERPGETPARAAATAGGAAGGGGAAQPAEGGESQEPAADPGLAGRLAGLLRRPGQTGGGGFGGLNQIVQAIRGPTPGGGGGGGFGGGGAPPVMTGDYLVSVTVDGKTMTRVLRVERGELGR